MIGRKSSGTEPTALAKGARIFHLAVGYIVACLFKLCAWCFRNLLLVKLIALRISAGKPLLVFVRFGAIGDIVCTFPAAARLIEKHPELHFVYVTLSEFKGLPELARLNGAVISSKIHCGIPRMPQWLAAVTIEPRYTDEFATEESSMHLVEEFCRASGVRFEALEDDGVRFELPAHLRAAAKKLVLGLKHDGTRVVAIHTGPTWPVRGWSNENWADLVDHLRNELGCRVLHIGASRHIELGKQELLNIPGTEPLIGHLSLPMLAAVIEQVDLVVGVDSGILHLAGAVGTPSVGLFGPTNPEFRLPRQTRSIGVFKRLPCSFCHHRQPRLHWIRGCPYGIQCMRELAPTSVFAACQELLAESGAGQQR